MVTIEEQIDLIAKEIRETPYHKGTEHHIGKLRARLSRLNDKLFESQGKGGGGGGGFAVRKQGNATVVLVGPPSVGKSTLINKLTNAQSKVAPYSFTTVTVIPGMMDYRWAKIQILDVPGLIKGARLGKGRGKEVLSVVRGADLVLIITDMDRWTQIDSIIDELEGAGVRINKKPPNIVVDKKLTGGLIIRSNIKQDVTQETIKNIAREYRLTNAEINLNEKVTVDSLIDKFSTNRVYRQALVVINKSENVALRLKQKIAERYPDVLFISAERGIALESLKEAIWKILEFTTVFLVESDEEPNFTHPLVTSSVYKLRDVLFELGADKSSRYKSAKIWGAGSKFGGQEVSLETKIKDGMQIKFL